MVARREQPRSAAAADDGSSLASPWLSPPGRPAVPELSEKVFASVWMACPAPLVLVDPAGVICAVNPAFTALTGTAESALVGRACWELLPAEVAMAALAGADAAVTAAWQVPEHILVDAVGNRHRVAWSLAAVSTGPVNGPGNGPVNGPGNGPGDPVLVLATGVDLTPERLVQETLREKADRDTLTGLANRAFLVRALTTCLDPFRGAGASVLFADLDGFKQVNDTYGHATGDAVLREVARRLSRLIRPDDIAARFGGDEFVVLVPAGGGFDCHALVTRLERALRRPITAHDVTVRVGVSIGVRVADVGQDADQVLHDADTAMYAAKQARQGRTNQR